MVCKKLPPFSRVGMGLLFWQQQEKHKTEIVIICSDLFSYIVRSNNSCLRLEFEYQYVLSVRQKTTKTGYIHFITYYFCSHINSSTKEKTRKQKDM